MVGRKEGWPRSGGHSSRQSASEQGGGGPGGAELSGCEVPEEGARQGQGGFPGKALLSLGCSGARWPLSPEARGRCPGSLRAPSPHPNSCLPASDTAGLSGWQDGTHPDGYQEPEPRWEGRDRGLRGRRGADDTCVTGTLPCSRSGAHCYPGALVRPLPNVPRDPFRLLAGLGPGAPAFPTCESSV